MAVVAMRKMTFEEFIALPEGDVAYELVDGELMPLMSPKIQHGRAQARLTTYLQNYLGSSFEGFLGDELDFPTIPYHGRRGDIVYMAPEHVTPADWERGYPDHPPDLVIEVVSRDKKDRARDTYDKRRECAATEMPTTGLWTPSSAPCKCSPWETTASTTCSSISPPAIPSPATSSPACGSRWTRCSGSRERTHE